MEDLQAIRRLKAGDMGGLEILVTRCQRKAVQTAYLITYDEQLAEDVTQETFVRLYQRIGRYDETRPLAPYLLRSVTNAALNAIEKRLAGCSTVQELTCSVSQNCSVKPALSKNRAMQRPEKGSSPSTGRTSTSTASCHRPALLPGHERTGDGPDACDCSWDRQMAVERCSRSAARPAPPGKERGLNPNDPERVLDEISLEHVRPDLDLLPGVLTTIEKGSIP